MKSSNQLSDLTGIEQLPSLNVLCASNNQIEVLDTVEQLAQLLDLSTLQLVGNPVTNADNYRLEVISRLPKLKVLDDQDVRAHGR